MTNSKVRRIAWIAVAVLGCILVGLTRFGESSAAADRFVPPGKPLRAAAVGSLKGLTPDLKIAFKPSDPSFAPIPSPGPSDWLANHTEMGQTFSQYQRGQPNRPDQERKTIYIQPLGDFPAEVAPDLDRICEFAELFFGLSVQQLDSVQLEGLPIDSRPRDEGRQILSTDVLDWLKPRVPDDAYCLLAVTMTDLYPDPKWNFVFGQASLNDRVGVYSFARYRDRSNDTQANERRLLLRSCKVLAHETGHMFGIKHCVHYHCLMNGSNNLPETDAAPIHLCPVCLRKLHWGHPFEVSDRYRDLRQFYASEGWDDEDVWVSERINRFPSSTLDSKSR